MTDEAEKLDSDEPRRVTPVASPSTALQEPLSQPSAAGEVAKALSGMLVSLFCATFAGRLALSDDPTPGPLGLPKWCYGLIGLVVIAVPTSAYQLRKAVQAVIALKGGK